MGRVAIPPWWHGEAMRQLRQIADGEACVLHRHRPKGRPKRRRSSVAHHRHRLTIQQSRDDAMLVAEERRGAVARLRGPMGGSMGPTELVHGDRDVSFLLFRFSRAALFLSVLKRGRLHCDPDSPVVHLTARSSLDASAREGGFPRRLPGGAALGRGARSGVASGGVGRTYPKHIHRRLRRWPPRLRRPRRPQRQPRRP